MKQKHRVCGWCDTEFDHEPAYINPKRGWVYCSAQCCNDAYAKNYKKVAQDKKKISAMLQ